jgi:PPP family 3-phenylpropionic acid transporter
MRVFGTLGFIFPSLLMFVLLKYGVNIRVMMTLSAAICFASLVNTFFLPDVQRTAIKGGRLPTRDALGVMFKRHVLFFSAGLWLMHMVSAAFYAFHPVYLRDVVGLEPKWIGLMANLGVTVEVFFMLSFGWLLRHLGLRKLLILGMLSTACRMAIMAYCSSLPMVLLSQCFHGMMVLVVHVTPPVFLNANARQSFRSSIQGLFAMVIAGTGRVTGNLVAGYLAKISLSLLYSYAMALCVLAAVIVGYGLRQWDMRHAYDAEETKTDPDESEEEPPETSSLLGRPE